MMAEFEITVETGYLCKSVIVMSDGRIICDIEVMQTENGPRIYVDPGYVHGYIPTDIPALIAALQRAQEIAAQWAADDVSEEAQS